MVFYTIWAFYLKSNNMKKINKYQTTELFNNDNSRLNSYESFVALTKDDNLVHTKKKLIPGVIYINQLESDPSKMITGDINGEIIQWIRQNSHRVLAKKTGEGTVTYIELDDTNSNKYAADGSEAKQMVQKVMYLLNYLHSIIMVLKVTMWKLNSVNLHLKIALNGILIF